MSETLKVGVCERCSRRVFLECPAGDETGELRAKVCARCTREEKHGPLVSEESFATALRRVLDLGAAPEERRADARLGAEHGPLLQVLWLRAPALSVVEGHRRGIRALQQVRQHRKGGGLVSTKKKKAPKPLVRRLRADVIELSPDGERLVLEDYDDAGLSARVSIHLDHATVRALAYSLRAWLEQQEAAAAATRAALEGKP